MFLILMLVVLMMPNQLCKHFIKISLLLMMKQRWNEKASIIAIEEIQYNLELLIRKGPQIRIKIQLLPEVMTFLLILIIQIAGLLL